MPLPKLSPLQSRLAASLIASIMLLILYFAFSSPQFAYAVDVDSIRREDHNHDRLGNAPFLAVDVEELELREDGVYEGQFQGFDKSIIGRAPTADDPQPLENNVPITANVVQGGTNSYSFLNSSIFSDPSLSAPPVVYISVNTCLQPTPIQNTTVDPPPQLQLYISQSQNNTNPGPTKDSGTQQMHILDGGAAMITVNATGDVFIGLYGESTTAYKDVWNAQIAASINGYYHTYHNQTDPNLYFVDSDSSSALLITGDLTSQNTSSPVYQALLDSPPPYVLFASNADDQTILGLQNSYCGMLNANIAPTASGLYAKTVQASLTTRGNNQPKQQFYIDSLVNNATYNVALGVAGNTTVVGGGGQVWPMTYFTTLSYDNCAVVYDLSFCDQTAYAVPGNPNIFPNVTSLAAFYDNNTQAQYQWFQNSLAQTACETTSSAQYSLARTCNDCAAAYKEWLCSVTIPRCTDWSSNLPWLQSRNMIQPFPNGTSLPPDVVSSANNSAYLRSSRNPNIDNFVQPGPYKEVLPCDNLCYSIVQSCPAAMSFNCPRPGGIGFSQSYGMMPNGSPEQQNQVTCNYPGAAQGRTSSGRRTAVPYAMVLIALVAMILMF